MFNRFFMPQISPSLISSLAFISRFSLVPTECSEILRIVFGEAASAIVPDDRNRFKLGDPMIGRPGHPDSSPEAAAGFLIRRRARLKPQLAPHRFRKNWELNHRLPILLFLEFAIMILYFVIGFVHQGSTTLLRDFTAGIEGYFFSALEIEPDDDTGLYPGTVPIYLKDKFLDTAMTISELLLNLSDTFPCASNLLSDRIVEMSLTFRGGGNYSTTLDQDNFTNLALILMFALPSTQLLTLTTPYVLRLDAGHLDETIMQNVTAMFVLDLRTNIFALNFAHSRDRRRSNVEFENALDNPNDTVPLAIALTAGLALLVSVIQLHSTYLFAREKAARDFQNFYSILWEKSDKWTVFGIIVHAISMIGGIMYRINGLDHRDPVPAPLAVLAVAGSLQCILLIRYFEPNSFTQLIVRVAARSARFLLEFMFGCLIMLAAYLIFGLCLFGTYNINFQSWVAAAEALIAVVHGDSIADRFTMAADRPDISYWASVFYWGLWVFFSMTIMFNISISIFEHMLETELEEDAKRKDNKTDREEPEFVAVAPVSLISLM
jgi:hypothetical protein